MAFSRECPEFRNLVKPGPDHYHTGRAPGGLRKGERRFRLTVAERGERLERLAERPLRAGGLRYLCQHLTLLPADSAELVLKLQHNPLCKLVSHPGGPGQRLGVLGRDSQSQTVRGKIRKQHQRELGSHPVDRGEQLEAGQLLLVGKAEEVDGILPHLQVGVKPRLAPARRKRGKGIERNGAAVAHPAAFDHRRAGLGEQQRPMQ